MDLGLRFQKVIDLEQLIIQGWYFGEKLSTSKDQLIAGFDVYIIAFKCYKVYWLSMTLRYKEKFNFHSYNTYYFKSTLRLLSLRVLLLYN